MNPDSSSTPPAVPVPPPLLVPTAVPLPPASPTPPAVPQPQALPQPQAQPHSLEEIQAAATAGIAAQAQQIKDEDNLVLDREWILKTKQIVHETAADPYEQNRRLAEVKADYLQKRYGKTIKLAE